ncbi:hypothetical protein BDR03DRAFT_528568 [Suillus americanus]|nr:hypothetical protein BDR03DRAFT_528568 [Suillus americanus]
MLRGLSPSQYQQNYYPPSSPVNWDEDPPPVVTQYHLMCGRDPTSNDQMPTLAHLHDAGFFQSSFPSEMTHPLPENDQRDVYIATGQLLHNEFFHSPFSYDPSANSLGFSGNVSESYPIESHPHPVPDDQSESHASDCLLVCKWNDGDGPCGKTEDSEREFVNHLSSFHLPPSMRTRIKCQWEGCTLQKFIRRDTVHRHIRQIHLRIRPRRQ